MLKKIKRANSILLFISIFLIGLFAFAEEKLEPLIPHKTDTPPVIDGILDDPVWQKSPYETGFKTYHPDYGKE